MKSEPNKRAIIVGLFILLGLVFLLAGILAIGNLHSTFVKKIHVSAIFNDVNGLQAGNNVWFSGVKIGTVNNLSFYGQSQVKVVVKIDEKSLQFIRKDAKMKISTDGLIGNKIIIIYGGTSLAPPVEDGDALTIEKIPSTDEMISTLQENNSNLLAITTDFKTISKKIVDGEGTVGKLLTDESLYNSLGVTLAALQKSSANAEKLTAAFSDYSAKLNQEGSLTNDLVTDTTVFNSIQASVQQLKQLTATAAEATDNLKAASTNVNNATGNLNSKNTPIGVMLNDEVSGSHMKVTIENLEDASQKLDEDLRAAQDNFLLRGYFKKQKKAEEKAVKEAEKEAEKKAKQ
ncbi:MAG TPA: MlaD family protein [Saprospiraceae bacterium]|nr:MlaD family protein [Saprospiraceae bacterium]